MTEVDLLTNTTVDYTSQYIQEFLSESSPIPYDETNNTITMTNGQARKLLYLAFMITQSATPNS